MLCNWNIRTQHISQKYKSEKSTFRYKPLASDIIDDRQRIFIGGIGNLIEESSIYIQYILS